MKVERIEKNGAKIYNLLDGANVKRRLIICKAKDLSNNI